MNDIVDPDLKGLAKLIEALEPWLSKVVIVGGWAHRLFRYHREARPVPYEPLITLDTDIAVPRTLEVKEQNLRARLQNAGFEEQFLGDNYPPVTHYRLGNEEGSFYAEFLTPL